MQQQYQPNNVGGMQPNPNSMMNQMPGGPAGMGANVLNSGVGPGSGMGYVQNSQQQMVPGGVGGGPQPQQQQNWNSFNSMQPQSQQQQQPQPQHQQQFYNPQNMSQQSKYSLVPLLHKRIPYSVRAQY